MKSRRGHELINKYTYIYVCNNVLFINSDLDIMLHFKSIRCHARTLPEGAGLSTKLFASES